MGVFTDLVQSARDFACELYRLQPGPLIPNPVSDALQMVWNDLCENHPPGLPPPPSAPFQGGQCCASRYEVYGYITFPNNPDNGVEQRLSINSIGTVAGIVKSLTGGGRSNLYQLKRVRCDGSIEFRDVLSVGINEVPQGVTISRVVPQYGDPDNCGDLPPEYPPGPSPPPDGFTSPPVVISLPDGSNKTVNFNITPQYYNVRPIINMPDIVVNVKDPKFNMPITFKFGGDVEVGPPSIPPVELPPDVVNTINNIENNTNNINNTTNNTNNTINNIFNPTPLDTHPDVEKHDSPIGAGKEEKEEGLLGILLSLTKLPDKMQVGSPSIYFAGWISFERDEGYLPREQINFQQSFFLAPPGATGYTITLTNGAEGVATVYSSKKSDS